MFTSVLLRYTNLFTDGIELLLVSRFLHVLVCECVPLPDSGQIHSPQCPQLYPVNLQKQWEISVPDGFQISLTFTHMNCDESITEIPYHSNCSFSVLYDEKVLGKFCGNENSADVEFTDVVHLHHGYQPILSPGNRLKLIFQSHDYNPDRNQNVGFSARYQAIDIDECSAPEPEDGSGPLCSQKCLNTLGSYRCACHHGYKLHSDQRACMCKFGEQRDFQVYLKSVSQHLDLEETGGEKCIIN
uniref:CUB domain-containing protein n=1 Tax=Poecilia reticulata TaxID=8081 RepID=A0A3P9P4N8_POERE